jgi:hypothetical protein
MRKLKPPWWQVRKAHSEMPLLAADWHNISGGIVQLDPAELAEDDW